MWLIRLGAKLRHQHATVELLEKNPVSIGKLQPRQLGQGRSL
jgi:hypothetical protein